MPHGSRDDGDGSSLLARIYTYQGVDVAFVKSARGLRRASHRTSITICMRQDGGGKSILLLFERSVVLGLLRTVHKTVGVSWPSSDDTLAGITSSVVISVSF